jgi:hypothetical protein
MEPSPSWEANNCLVTQEIKNFMEPEDSLLCSQESVIGIYPNPD